MVNQWMSGDRLRTDTSRLYRSLVVVKPKLGRFSKALHACNDAANPSWTLRGLEIRSIVFVIEFAYVCLIYSCNNRKGKGCEWNWWKRVWLENEWKWLPTKWGCHFHRSNFGQLHRRFDSKMMVSFDILVGKVNSSPRDYHRKCSIVRCVQYFTSSRFVCGKCFLLNTSHTDPSRSAPRIFLVLAERVVD